MLPPLLGDVPQARVRRARLRRPGWPAARTCPCSSCRSARRRQRDAITGGITGRGISRHACCLWHCVPHFLMGAIMVRLLKSLAAKPRKPIAPYRASRSIRRRPRETRAALAVMEEQEGTTDADWQLWEDSMVAFDSQFQSMKDPFAQVD